MDTQGQNKTLQVVFAFFVGGLLFSSILIFYAIFPAATPGQLKMFLFMVLPALSYVWSLGVNTLIQYLSCKKIRIGQVALASLAPLGFTVGFGLLAYSFGFLRAPVLSALFFVSDATTQYALSIAFYLFWAGAYGQTVAAGLVTGCAG